MHLSGFTKADRGNGSTIYLQCFW